MMLPVTGNTDMTATTLWSAGEHSGKRVRTGSGTHHPWQQRSLVSQDFPGPCKSSMVATLVVRVARSVSSLPQYLPDAIHHGRAVGPCLQRRLHVDLDEPHGHVRLQLTDQVHVGGYHGAYHEVAAT